ncbi:uncharacterized protein AMSG_06808 [Thecamonas trahens ATCC 50062]|uniref:Uncharacterized protein n=1 Tax=Thecamonas trahens ATCC 50062 TaxID=461836 RepID=A0A0L0DDM7_THETB|nr:hypothetical protein AMSG_06808 [Thecamonas trahens ATCC 50062]KNC50325.1 hypothetical protein AMSG_06808 [Thecamonas trahens ATCC 50062]|eukprot:XP_013756871.1 hypothetical protein AMSG_06808 [Thecamonas trahens ATCC 50062]
MSTAEDKVIKVYGRCACEALCHCTICRKCSGAPVSHLIGFANPRCVSVAPSSFFEANGRDADVSAADEEATFAALICHKTSETMCRYSCPHCGSSLVNVSLLPESAPPGPFRDLPTGILEHDDNGKPIGYADFAPQAHMFYTRRLADHLDGLPKFGTYPGTDLVPETDAEPESAA